MPTRSKQDIKTLLNALQIQCDIDDEVFEIVSENNATIKAFIKNEISFQEALFIEHYIANGFHAGRAAQAANFRGLEAGAYGRVGGAVLKRDAVRRLIARRLTAAALTADEVAAEWAEVAKADMTTFFDVREQEVENPADPANPFVVKTLVPDLAKAEEAGKLHLIKKYRLGADGSIQFELRDQDKALDQIARHLGMFEKDNMLQIPKGLVELLSQSPEERREALKEYDDLLESDD